MNVATQQLHSLLIINSTGLDKQTIQKLLNVSENELDSAIEQLNKYLTDSGVALVQTDTSLQIAAQTDILPSGIQKELQTEQLSAALLEVLTIVAYHQPITQIEIETMRGIGSEQTLKGLTERNLISAKQKKVDGISVSHYVTTGEFLAHLGITSIDQLPNLTEKDKPNATK